MKRGVKMDPKRIVLFEVKLVSRDKMIYIPYNIHIHTFRNETTCDCKHHLKKDNDSRLLLNVRTQRG